MRGGFGETRNGNATNDASHNTMYLYNAEIYAGWMSAGDASSYNNTKNDVDSNGNSLTVEGGSAWEQYVGGYAGSYGSIGGTADASNNTLKLTDATAPMCIPAGPTLQLAAAIQMPIQIPLPYLAVRLRLQKPTAVMLIQTRAAM